MQTPKLHCCMAVFMKIIKQEKKYEKYKTALGSVVSLRTILTSKLTFICGNEHNRCKTKHISFIGNTFNVYKFSELMNQITITSSLKQLNMLYNAVKQDIPLHSQYQSLLTIHANTTLHIKITSR